jgi:MFS family permease
LETPEAVPPGAEGPGMRELLARLPIDTRPLRESRSFRRLWIGQAISYLGGEIIIVAVPYQLYRLTGSTLQVGLISLVELVPLLTLTLVGGAIADGVERRRMLILTQLGLMLQSALFALNASLAEPRVWALYVIGAFGASTFALGRPALTSLTPQLVADDQYAAASALEGITSSFGAVAGPAFAGLIIAAIGLPATYSIDVVTNGVALGCMWLLPRFPPAPDADRPGLRSILEAFRYLGRQKVVLAFFLVDTNAMVFGMPSALFPALAIHRFHGGAGVVGLLYAAPYAGALGASLLSGWVGHVRRQGLVIVIAASLWGAAIAAFGFATTLWVGLLLLALAGAADLVSAVLRSTILMSVTPKSMLGRMLGLEFAQVASAPALGNLEAGVVASVTSLRLSVVSGGILCVAGTIAIALALPALVRYDAKAARA